MKMENLLQEIQLLPQECGGKYQFNGQLVTTRGFLNKFADLATMLAIVTVTKIITEHVQTVNGADYLQVCIYNNIKYWVIDDVEVVTVLLPEEY